MTDTPMFDREDAMARVEGDVELLKELAALCSEDFRDKFPQLRAAIQSGESKRASELAHSMKSAFGNLGAMQAFEAARLLERAGKEGDFAALQSGIERFEQACVAFLQFFDKEFGC